MRVSLAVFAIFRRLPRGLGIRWQNERPRDGQRRQRKPSNALLRGPGRVIYAYLSAWTEISASFSRHDLRVCRSVRLIVLMRPSKTSAIPAGRTSFFSSERRRCRDNASNKGRQRPSNFPSSRRYCALPIG